MKPEITMLTKIKGRFTKILIKEFIVEEAILLAKLFKLVVNWSESASDAVGKRFFITPYMLTD